MSVQVPMVRLHDDSAASQASEASSGSGSDSDSDSNDLVELSRRESRCHSFSTSRGRVELLQCETKDDRNPAVTPAARREPQTPQVQAFLMRKSVSNADLRPEPSASRLSLSSSRNADQSIVRPSDLERRSSTSGESPAFEPVEYLSDFEESDSNDSKIGSKSQRLKPDVVCGNVDLLSILKNGTPFLKYGHKGLAFFSSQFLAKLLFRCAIRLSTLSSFPHICGQ